MTLFEMPDDREYQGQYAGQNPTDTEAASGAAVERDRKGPIKRGGAEHRVLTAFMHGQRLTAYDASFLVAGDWHSKRREMRRLYDRGYVRKDGTLPNRSPAGRPHVDAFVITDAGIKAL